jgi:hypothetical protein
VQAVRRRRLVLAAAAIAVAGVVAVPVAVNAPRPEPSAVVPLSVPLAYSPGRLPAGYAEYHRSVQPATGAIVRGWASAAPPSPLLIDDVPGRITMTVVATANAEVTKDPGDRAADINGAAGRYRTEGPSGVYWVTGGFTIEIRGDDAGPSNAVLLDMARSVRPDPAPLRMPFGVRLPAGQQIVAQTVQGTSPTAWLALVDLGEPDPEGGDISATGTSIKVGTMTPAVAGGTALQVAGHPARYLYAEVPEAGNYLVVELGNGLLLTVYAMDLDQPAIIALAEATGLADAGTVTWLGR